MASQVTALVQLADGPHKQTTCSMARYAFNAYSTLKMKAGYARGSTGAAQVTFLDSEFIEQTFNCPGGGLLEVTLPPADNCAALKTFAFAELSIEMCSFGAGGGGFRRQGAAGGPRGGIRGGAVVVALPATAPIHFGVRDKAQDVLHVTLYEQNPNDASSCKLSISLSDVPYKDATTKVVPLTPPSEDQQQAGVAGLASGTGHQLPLSLSLSWRLIPYADCQPEQFAPQQQAESRENVLQEIESAELRGMGFIVREVFKNAVDLSGEAMSTVQQRIARQRQQAPPLDWDVLSAAAGAANLRPLAVIVCADRDTQVWLHRNLDNREVVVAFRGTVEDSLANWFTDISRGFMPPVELNPMLPVETTTGSGGSSTLAVAATPSAQQPQQQQVLVHKGFLEAYMEVRETVAAILDVLVFGRQQQQAGSTTAAAAATTATITAAGGDAATQQQQQQQAPAAAATAAGGGVNGTQQPKQQQQDGGPSGPSCTRVILCGHSLGGALATLAAYDLGARKYDGFYSGDLLLLTFGCPRVGNEAFMNSFNSLVTRAWRFTNTKDLVPRVPTDGPLNGGIIGWPSAEYFHVGAHWDLEAPEADPALRMGLAADSGPQRLPIPDSVTGLVEAIEAHLTDAYYAGVWNYFKLGPQQRQQAPPAATPMAEPAGDAKPASNDNTNPPARADDSSSGGGGGVVSHVQKLAPYGWISISAAAGLLLALFVARVRASGGQ